MKPYFLDEHEKILWQSKPSKLMYLFNGFNLFVFLFLIVWSSIVITIGGHFFSISNEFRKLDFPVDNFFKTPFSIFSLVPLIFFFIIFTIFVIFPIKRIIESFKVKYYVTDLRVYIESGIIGTDIQSLEYKEISKLNVNVNLLGKLLHRGTVSLTPDRSYSDGDGSYTISGIKLIGIENPYEIYNMIKKNALDVTTDQQYPNAYRPDNNTCYHTKLDN